MYVFTGIKQNNNLLRVYCLKHCYQQAKIIQKEKNQKYVSNCIIIRKQQSKNMTDFGYKEQFKTNILKKINFVYLPTITDLIAFIWSHLQLPQPMVGMIFIQNLEQYIGEQFVYYECGRDMTVLTNLMILYSKKIKRGRIAFSLSYNKSVFDDRGFKKYLDKYRITHWHVGSQQVLKNSEKFSSIYVENFLQLYSHQAQVKIPDEE